MYAITVHQLENGRRVDLEFFTTARTAAAMEAVVTELHREYPAPCFEVVVTTD